MTADPDGRSELDRLGRALRSVQDRVAHTGAPEDVASSAADALERAAALLDRFVYDPVTDKAWGDAVPGTRTICPPLRIVSCDGDRLDAVVQFTPFHLGANGAAHGGTLPIVFDTVFGLLSNFGRATSRTASLKVDYRNVTPLGLDLDVRAQIERIDGRKRHLSGAIRHGGVVTAEATALLVELTRGAA